MHYVAYISREGNQVLADFPDCPGCQTFADDGDELAEAAREALEGWLEANLVAGKVPPGPLAAPGAPSGMKLARVSVRAGRAAARSLWRAPQEAGVSEDARGGRAGVSQHEIAKLEGRADNPSLETLAKVR